MYNVVLNLHNWLRWVVLLAGAAAAVMGLLGWLNRRNWAGLDNRLGLIFTISMDLQLLLGLLLYFILSPLVRAAFADFGAAMSNSDLRYFAVEHLALMLLAVILVHVGRARSRRAATDLLKHRQAAIFYSLAMAAMLLATPWFRPLLRMGLAVE